MQNWTKYKVAIVFVVAICLVSLGFFATSKHVFFTGKSYSPVYTLVDDKVSQSASIIVNLPKGVAKEGAENFVKFEPAIKGHWASSGNLKNSIIFEPTEPLSVGDRHTAVFSSGETVLSKDFVIVEDPKILAVIPSDKSEANENSKITIVFNRPMVPLSTLSESESKNIPIQILPVTEGKFKWISTKTLQFIPKERLHYSSNYSVKILNGFASMDGVPVKSATYNFTTRKIELYNSSSGTIMYDQPIDIKFNVPIDLDKTVTSLSVTNLQSGAPVPVVVEYGKKYAYGPDGKPTKVIVDRSTMSIYPKSDSYGRDRVWNFGSGVAVNMTRAYSLDGNIDLVSKISFPVYISDVIKDVKVVSSRSSSVSEQVFDPAGAIQVNFFEDINLSATSISAKGLSGIKYGEKCKDPENYGQNDGCEKVENKSSIVISFNQNELKPGETFNLTFKKIVNSQGMTVNDKPIIRSISVYPELKIFSTTPASSSSNANLTNLIICSNTPLQVKNGSNYKDAIKSNNYLVFSSWGYPYKSNGSVDGKGKLYDCKQGQFVTSIRYGLHPNVNYDLSLNLVDEFGQSVQKNISFKTGEAASFNTRLFSLQKIYSVTTTNKTKLTFGSENLEYVDVSICKVSAANMIKYLRNAQSDERSVNNNECISKVNKRIELPHKYWVNNYFQIDLKDYLANTSGQYVISLTNPKFRGYYDGAQAYLMSYVSVTNLAVTEKKTALSKYDELPELTKSALNEIGEGSNLYWVTNSNTLESIPGASVKVYSDSGDYGSAIFETASGKTENDGVAKVKITKDVVGAVVTYGDDTAIISANNDNLSWSPSAYSQSKTYVYTDRPIYRPGQEVYIKGISRFQFDGYSEIVDKKTAEIKIYDSKNQVVLKQDVPVTDFGTFSTKLVLPEEAALGTYRIESMYGYFYFDVSEYVGAAFETITSSDKEEYVAGDTAKVSVAAKYYFGVPVAGGKLTYSWTAQNYYFDKYKDGYFDFGNDWYSCWDCGYGDSYIGRGETNLDLLGQAKIEKDLNFEKIFTNSKDSSKVMSKIFVLHGTIVDSTGKTVSFQKSFVVHKGDYYIGAKVDPYFAGTGDPITVKAKTVNTSGEPVSKMGLKLKAYKVSWESAKRQEVDGGYYNQYERVLKEVSNKIFSTDSAGNGEATLKFDESGEYQITVSGTDSRGNKISTDTYTYIYGPGNVSVQPRNNETLDIISDKKEYKSGENAKIIIKSPFKNARALISVERGGIYSYEIVSIKQSIYEYTVPILDSYAPNIYISAFLLGDGPQMKFGEVQVKVNSDVKKLNVEVIPNKPSYLPGEKVKLLVKTTDSSGRPQSSEVSVAVADLSVLALKGNQKKDPSVFFYGGLPLFVSTASNIKNLLQETDIPTGTKGGDGSSPDDLSKKKRGEFKDTAFWEANVLTGQNGIGSVEFTLPDNLTRWQVESIGVTKDTKLGVNYKEITVAKNVMAIPLAPRFIIPGDEFSIGVNVFNQSTSPLSMSVTFDSQTLEMDGPSQQSVNIGNGENKTLYFKVKAPKNLDEGSHKFVISAKSGNYEDTVEKSIKITRNETYESVATYGSTDKNSATEYIYLPDDVLKDKGGLKIIAQASLAFFLKDAVSYLAQFPYGCSEQMGSKLKMLALLKYANSKDVLNGKLDMPKIEFDGVSYDVDTAVNSGIKRILENQNYDGGFGYYSGMSSSNELTINIYETLSIIKKAGYAVPQSTLDQASSYIENRLNEYYKRVSLNTENIDDLIMTASALSQTDNRPAFYNKLINVIKSDINSSYLSNSASSKALVNLALIMANESSLSWSKLQVFNTLENRVNIDSRGSYVKSNPKKTLWYYYENSVSNTAQYLKALVKSDKSSTQVENALRWLLSNRDKNGVWGSTDTTYNVMDALVTYLAKTKEGNSEFDLAILFDGKSVASKQFKGKSALLPLEKFLPISTFELNKSHKLEFVKTNSSNKNNFYYDLGLTYYQSAEEIAPRDEGIYITRNYFRLTDPKGKKPISEAKVGEVIRGQIKVVASNDMPLFAVESFIPAGFELVDDTLSTEANYSIDQYDEVIYNDNNVISQIASEWNKQIAAVYDDSLPQVFAESLDVTDPETKLRADFKELHDDRLFLFKETLYPGQYVYNFYIRATTPGTFQEPPAVAKLLYFPEIFGRTSGSLFTVSR